MKLGKTQYIMGALYKGLAVAGILAAGAFYFASVSGSSSRESSRHSAR
ncbi:MAG: hypothetical protein AB9919_00435 [Geobacteraceae bacterium]